MVIIRAPKRRFPRVSLGDVSTDFDIAKHMTLVSITAVVALILTGVAVAHTYRTS